MPYHVRITPKSEKSRAEVKLDLTEEMLEKRFLTPYREGRPIVIGGRTIPTGDINRIRITYTEESSDKLFPLVRNERRASHVTVFPPISDEWYVADKGKDVTDELILESPGMPPPVPSPSASRPRVVFVVHGRNAILRDAMFSFLRAIGLHPLEWNEAVLATGNPTPYIAEVLDKAFNAAQAVVVMFSPDDEARLREPFHNGNEAPHETTLTPQARANVIFEAGMAMGRDARRTVLVEVGTLRPFTDIAGLHVVRLDNSTQRRQELAQRLESAGCSVNTSGTDWHTAGDFSVLEPKSSRPTQRKR